MWPGKAVAAAVALAAAAPAAADLLPPNPDRKQFIIPAWNLWCTVDRASGTLDDCSLTSMVDWVTLRVQVYAGAMHYSLSRDCVAGPIGGHAYRDGVVAMGPVEKSAMWHDFVALHDLPRDPRCTGTPPNAGGNFTDDTDTALAMLRTLSPSLASLPPAPLPPARTAPN